MRIWMFFPDVFFKWEDFTSSLNGDILGIFNNNSNGDVEGDGERETVDIHRRSSQYLNRLPWPG